MIAGITGIHNNYNNIISYHSLYYIGSVLALQSQKLITGTAQDVLKLVLHNFDPIVKLDNL